MMTAFQPELYTITDLVQLLPRNRVQIRGNLITLLEESPASVYRLRKIPSRSDWVVETETVEYLRNWRQRGNLQFVRSITSPDKEIGKEEVEEAKRKLEEEKQLNK